MPACEDNSHGILALCIAVTVSRFRPEIRTSVGLSLIQYGIESSQYPILTMLLSISLKLIFHEKEKIEEETYPIILFYKNI